MRGHLRTSTQKKMEDWGKGAVSTKVRVLGTRVRFARRAQKSQRQLDSWHQLKFSRKLRGRTQKVPTSATDCL